MKRSDVATVSVLVASMAAVVAGCRTVPPRPASNVPYHDDISFRGFVEEALYGHATPRTHRFDDYTKGSYHVHPREVVEGVFKAAPTYKLKVEAVAVVGPYGPLWTYDVISTVREEGCTRVNWLVMAHARITVKRSGCISPESVASFLNDMGEVASSAEQVSKESCLVVARPGELRWSRFDCYTRDTPPERERMAAALERLSRSLTITYSGYPPVSEEQP